MASPRDLIEQLAHIYEPEISLLSWNDHLLTFEDRTLAVKERLRYPVILKSGDRYPSHTTQGEDPFLRLLEGRTDTDGRYQLTIMAMKYGEPRDFDLAEYTNTLHTDLRRTGITYNLQASVPAIDLNQNIALATTAGRQRPKVKLTATLIRFKLV